MAGFEAVRGGTAQAPHRGLWIAVSGPDGAGKSAVIQRLAQLLSPPFCGVEQFHFRPRVGSGQQNGTPVLTPHAKPARGTLISICKLLYWLADCWLGYLAAIRPARAASQLVIFDRYYYDILVDPLRYRLPKSSLWFGERMVRLAPRPDLNLLLDVPAEVVQLRKQEVSPAESQRQRRAYFRMFQSLPNSLIVDAVSPVEEVAQQVASVVLRRLASHSMERNEAWIANL